MQIGTFCFQIWPPIFQRISLFKARSGQENFLDQLFFQLYEENAEFERQADVKWILILATTRIFFWRKRFLLQVTIYILFLSLSRGIFFLFVQGCSNIFLSMVAVSIYVKSGRKQQAELVTSSSRILLVLFTGKYATEDREEFHSIDKWAQHSNFESSSNQSQIVPNSQGTLQIDIIWWKNGAALSTKTF